MFVNPSARTWRYTAEAVDDTTGPVEAFHKALPDYNVTPLIALPELANELGVADVLIKDESHRFGLPAFKILGASWAIYRAVASKCKLPLTCSLEELGKAARASGLILVTCTEGNWGRATARMARYLGIQAVIFVPGFMDEPTQVKISGEGAKVIVVDGDYDASIRQARMEAEGEGKLLVMDVAWEGFVEIPEWVVEGYRTLLLETDRQLDEMVGTHATHVFASVGVGSWAQAVAMHYKAKTPSAAVVTVEPDTAAGLLASLFAGEITPIETGHTIMNGMNCGTVSYTAWQVLKEGIDVCVTVTDLEVHRDVQYLHSQGIRNGPCGAAPLSALRKLSKERGLGLDRHSVVVLFSTEGARGYIEPSGQLSSC